MSHNSNHLPTSRGEGGEHADDTYRVPTLHQVAEYNPTHNRRKKGLVAGGALALAALSASAAFLMGNQSPNAEAKTPPVAEASDWPASEAPEATAPSPEMTETAPALTVEDFMLDPELSKDEIPAAFVEKLELFVNMGDPKAAAEGYKELKKQDSTTDFWKYIDGEVEKLAVEYLYPGLFDNDHANIVNKPFAAEVLKDGSRVLAANTLAYMNNQEGVTAELTNVPGNGADPGGSPSFEVTYDTIITLKAQSPALDQYKDYLDLEQSQTTIVHLGVTYLKDGKLSMPNAADRLKVSEVILPDTGLYS